MVLIPFQRLLYCSRSATRKFDILLCASVHLIYSFDLSDGNILSKWPPWPGLSTKSPQRIKGNKSHETTTNPALEEYREANGSRPLKRQKMLPEKESFESSSTEIVVDEVQTVDHGDNHLLSLDPSIAIIKLAATSNGQYVVAVTDEDKCIRVLKLQDNGELIQHSARYPHRHQTIAHTS